MGQLSAEEMYFLTLWNARFSGVRYSRFALLSHLIECVTIRVTVYRHFLQVKVTRRHLSLYYCQFSFILPLVLRAIYSV